MLKMYKKVVIDNYANFKGRARRKQYWYYCLVNAIILTVLKIVDTTYGLTIGVGHFGLLYSIYTLVFLLPGIAVAVRRMHDVGKSGWCMFIPFYNIVLGCTQGEKGYNEYGTDPKRLVDELDEIGKE